MEDLEPSRYFEDDDMGNESSEGLDSYIVERHQRHSSMRKCMGVQQASS